MLQVNIYIHIYVLINCIIASLIDMVSTGILEQYSHLNIFIIKPAVVW